VNVTGIFWLVSRYQYLPCDLTPVVGAVYGIMDYDVIRR
ncbi:uncharacterized protein METZ01_LOCUS244957, partial [marine metagenome]